MNKLKAEKQEIVIRALVEGASIRSVERMTGVHRDTIIRLGVRVGTTCRSILDELMRDLNCERIELDEVWMFVGKKERHVREDEDKSEVGDHWCWVALDSESKLVPAFRVGKRDAETARVLLRSEVPHGVAEVEDHCADGCHRLLHPDAAYGELGLSAWYRFDEDLEADIHHLERDGDLLAGEGLYGFGVPEAIAG